MIIKLDVPDYDGNAMDVVWETNANMSIHINNNNVVILANEQALVSLAKQMMYMANTDLPVGSHVHYDDFFIQNNINNYELIIEKVKNDI